LIKNGAVSERECKLLFRDNEHAPRTKTNIFNHWKFTSMVVCKHQTVATFTAPFFINLQRTVVIFDDEPVAANIYKVKYYNGDTRDVLTWTFTSTSTKYAFDTSTGTLEHTKHTHRHMYIYCV
jgi:hypothetical protein